MKGLNDVSFVITSTWNELFYTNTYATKLTREKLLG